MACELASLMMALNIESNSLAVLLGMESLSSMAVFIGIAASYGKGVQFGNENFYNKRLPSREAI
jgi:hypothetical protein